MSALPFLSQLLVEEFGVHPDDVRPEATPVEMGLDSLSTAELVREVEREFEIVLSDDQANFGTLGEAVRIVDELIGTSGA